MGALLYHNGLRRDESIKALEFPIRTGRDSGSGGGGFTGRWSAGEAVCPGPDRDWKDTFDRLPALKAIGEGHGRNPLLPDGEDDADGAEEALAILRERGLFGHDHGKGKSCVFGKPVCNPKCLRAKGHFDRVNDAAKILHQNLNHAFGNFRVCGKIFRSARLSSASIFLFVCGWDHL